MFFPVMKPGIMGLRENLVSVIFIISYGFMGAYCQHELSLLYGPWSYGRGRVCRRLKLLPFCAALLWKEVTVYGPHLVGSYARPPWGCCLCINYLRVFFTGDFSLLPACLIIYQCGFMAVYFILCITAQCYFIVLLRLSQLWLWRVLWFGPCVTLTYPIVIFVLVWFLVASLLSGTTRCPRLPSCVLLAQSWIQLFLQGPFIERMVIRAQDLDG